MSRNFLSVARIERTLQSGGIEYLEFKSGVNLLIGPPNAGKTKWLQMLDHLLGDPESFDSAFEEDLVAKYQASAAYLLIGEKRLRVERRWKSPGVKTKVFVDGTEMTAREFQHKLMELLGIPLLHFPKGNPFSGQTWPELSFRMLLRHIHRQQRFWGGLVDQQPEGEQLACILQFLGVAERIYDDSYGELVQLRMEVGRLKSRRDQYGQTLDDLASETVSEANQSVSVSVATVERTQKRLEAELEALNDRRQQAIVSARDQTISHDNRHVVLSLTDERASLIVARADLSLKVKATAERVVEMRQYRDDLLTENERLQRASDAGGVFADLKITHCPACDRTVDPVPPSEEHCQLCLRVLPDDVASDSLGASRIAFEQERIKAEVKEADELLAMLGRDEQELKLALIHGGERLRMIDVELEPARRAVAGLVNQEVGAIDVAIGVLNERQRQLGRVGAALELGQRLSLDIEALELRIVPLRERVEELERAADFDAAEALLGAGMNEYLQAIHELKPAAWGHSQVSVNLSRSSFSIKVGQKKWSLALGATNALYFLMSYHFGLLTLSSNSQCHYPGFAVIDLPGDFLGESVEDKENFIVQPFIDLLAQEEFVGAQVIMTGASFKGLKGAHRVELRQVFAG